MLDIFSLVDRYTNFGFNFFFLSHSWSNFLFLYRESAVSEIRPFWTCRKLKMSRISEGSLIYLFSCKI